MGSTVSGKTTKTKEKLSVGRQGKNGVSEKKSSTKRLDPSLAQDYRVDLHKALHEYFGFDKFKGTQEKVIESLLAGHDTFVIMPTGGGKSLCYQLPAMVSEGVAIIVSPLIALMKNQVDLMRGYSSKDDVAHFLNSTLTKKEIKEVHDDLLTGKTKDRKSVV